MKRLLFYALALGITGQMLASDTVTVHNTTSQRIKVTRHPVQVWESPCGPVYSFIEAGAKRDFSKKCTFDLFGSTGQVGTISMGRAGYEQKSDYKIVEKNGKITLE